MRGEGNREEKERGLNRDRCWAQVTWQKDSLPHRRFRPESWHNGPVTVRLAHSLRTQFTKEKRSVKNANKKRHLRNGKLKYLDRYACSKSSHSSKGKKKASTNSVLAGVKTIITFCWTSYQLAIRCVIQVLGFLLPYLSYRVITHLFYWQTGGNFYIYQ